MATVSFADNDDTNKDVLFRQYISQPLVAGQTITGAQSIKAQCRVAERNASCNMFLTLGIRVIASDGTTVRKTVLAVTRDNTEALTSLTNRQFTATSAATNYTTQAGDRLCIEIGTGGDPNNGSDHDSDLRLGDSAASDLAEDDASTSDFRPWVQLNDTLAFVFTASASITRTGTTASGSATHVTPTYTGTAAITRGGTTGTGSATFTPKYTGTAAVTRGPTTASGSANYTAQPVYTAQAAVTRGATTASASGWTSSPHNVGILTQPNYGLWQRRYGSFSGKSVTPPYSEATASITRGATTCTASGWSSSPHLVGKITQPRFGLYGARYGDFTGKGTQQFTASASITRGATTATASATFVPPTSTGTASITRGGATSSGSATHVTPTYTASASVSRGPTTANASATFTAPVYTASASITLGAKTATGSAIHIVSVSNGSASVSHGASTATGSATFTNPIYAGTASLTHGPTTAIGSAQYTSGSNATAALTRGSTICQGTARTVFGAGGRLLMLRRRNAAR